MTAPWYSKTFRRAVIDMHITDHDPRFMRRFDVAEYIGALVKAQAQSVVAYADSCVGLTFYPTQVGQMHRNLAGRDIVAEVIEGCHRAGIAVAVYMSVIFERWAYDHDPDWRIYRADGKEAAPTGRNGVCCPNSPYRHYARAIAEEIVRRYDFEGIRFDMTFWPGVCYCRHCRRRFAEEVGGDLPEIVNWEDPRWVAFQRGRERWLIEFATMLTTAVKSIKPHLSVEHQASTFPSTWQFGVSYALAKQNTFLQGDFYGDIAQGSFARKLFYNLTEHLPGGFETCSSVDLANYTALKSEELLLCKASAALADGCAFIFIDSIDPEGTLNPAVYERLGRVWEQTRVYEPYLGGAPRQDVAIFFSTESKCDFADNGKRVDDPKLASKFPHVEDAVSVAKSLMERHIPFGVITKRNIGDLARHKIVVLPNVLMMDEEEAQAFREYVAAGGCLYASRATSLVDKTGVRHPDFMLADVFGAHCLGETPERFTYMVPVAGAEGLFDPMYTREHGMGLHGKQMQVRVDPGTEVFARITLPYTDPADPQRYASLHNNPPGVQTDYPAILLHRYGKGKVLYATGDLEGEDTTRSVFINLLGLLGDQFSFEADAPKPVEVTMFDQPEAHRWIINLVNFQKDLPNIPVDGIRVRVRLDGRVPGRLLLLPAEQALPHQVVDGYLHFTAPRLETFAMFALEYT